MIAMLVFPAKKLPQNIASVFLGSMIFSSAGEKLEASLLWSVNQTL